MIFSNFSRIFVGDRKNVLCAIGIVFGIAVASTMLSSSSSVTASSNIQTTMHALEDPKSWKLHLDRQASAAAAAASQSGSFLESAMAAITGDPSDAESQEKDKDEQIGKEVEGEDGGKEKGEKDKDEEDDWKLPFNVKHKKPKKHIPIPGGETTHGLLIDAGSKGTRLHIYEWEKRFLLDEDDLLEQMNGLKLSYPTSNNRWTDKYTPGLQNFAALSDEPEHLEEELKKYLGSLLDFPKTILADKKDEWHNYPIYLKATGGMRELTKKNRTKVINIVRKLFHDKEFNPFHFKDERARVISGEEEAIYGWMSVNFATDVLIESSKGSGEGKHSKYTYGIIEMGGASTQIAFFENNDDIMANLFKLQLGGSRHWNVYAHSFLYFGIHGAWARSNANLNWEGKSIHPCLPIGSSVKFDSWIHLNDKEQLIPLSDPRSTPYSITISSNNSTFYYDHCSSHAYRLLRKETNQEWCDFQWDGKCSFAGIYQPPIPKKISKNEKFIATSTVADIYEFLRLREKSYIHEIGAASESVCNLTWEQLKAYNTQFGSPLVKDDQELAQMCFRSVFLYQLLKYGWEFGDDYRLTAVATVKGYPTGWALGCMLYEINTLPWKFRPEFLYRGPSKLLVAVYVVVGTLVGLGVGFILAMNLNKSFNKKVRKSLFYNHPEWVQNRVLRKSLSLPMDMDFSDLDEDSSGDDPTEGTSLLKE